MKPNEYLVQGETVQNHFKYLENNLVTCTRHQNWSKSDIRQIDVSGSFWVFAIFEIQYENFYFLKDSDNSKIPVSQNIAFYLPPFSIFETLTNQGPLSWKAFISMSKPPNGSPTQPTLMLWDSNKNISTVEDIWTYIQDQKQNWIAVGKGADTISPIAYKAKKNIDLRYTELFQFSEFSKQLGLTHEVVDRSFKKTFGLTPQLYRRKLRVTQALILMVIKGHGVSHVCHEVGYSDIDNFSKQFKKTFESKPSQYRPPKIIRDQDLSVE